MQLANFRQIDFLVPFFANGLRELIQRKDAGVYIDDVPYIARVLGTFSSATGFTFKQEDTFWMIRDSKGESVPIVSINITDPIVVREVADSYLTRITFFPNSYYLEDKYVLARVSYMYKTLSNVTEDEALKRTLFALSLNIYFWRTTLPELPAIIAPTILVSRK